MQIITFLVEKTNTGYCAYSKSHSILAAAPTLAELYQDAHDGLEDQFGGTGENPADFTLQFTIPTIQIHDIRHSDEVVDRMLVLEEQPDPESNIELTMLAQAIKEFDDQHTPEPAMPQAMRFSEIRNDEEHAAAVDYLIKLNQSPKADAHLEEINACGELVENYEIRNGHTFHTPLDEEE
jgi:hypothetical protein